MTQQSPKQLENTITPIGIIGGGFGALMAYAVLRFRGIPAGDIRIFSADSSPEHSWMRMVEAINQRGMRSESVGHFFPTDSPGLATLEAVSTWSLKPIILSWFDRYHPSVEYIVRHAKTLARQIHFWHALRHVRVGRIERLADSFVIYDSNGQRCGQVRHAILAIGHGNLAMPSAAAAYQQAHPDDARVRHAFTTKDYMPNETVVVMGDGLTAGTEWMNILERGGSVVAISNRGFSFGQQLNTPRQYFSKRGIAPFLQQPAPDRLAELVAATRGTIPGYPYWRRMFRASQKNGKLQLIHGDVIAIRPVDQATVECLVRLPDGHSFQPVHVNRVIVATGFAPAITHPLLKQLIEDYNLPLAGSYLAVDEHCCIAQMSTPTSCMAVVGPTAAWALPCADSLVGMKIAARQIGERIVGEETWRPRELFAKINAWLRLMKGAELL